MSTFGFDIYFAKELNMWLNSRVSIGNLLIFSLRRFIKIEKIGLKEYKGESEIQFAAILPLISEASSIAKIPLVKRTLFIYLFIVSASFWISYLFCFSVKYVVEF